MPWSAAFTERSDLLEIDLTSERLRMRVLGVEFAAGDMNCVVVEVNDQPIVSGSFKLTLGGSRDAGALRAFQTAVYALLTEQAPELIAVKDKPEQGRMRAGASSLKMEGILWPTLRAKLYSFLGQKLTSRNPSRVNWQPISVQQLAQRWPHRTGEFRVGTSAGCR